MDYINRACALGFKTACKTSTDINMRPKKSQKRKAGYYDNAFHGQCFGDSDIYQAEFTPIVISATLVRGQRISHIKVNSYWIQVGLKEDDIVMRVNNKSFNTVAEIHSALRATHKKFAFEVEREGSLITLWYNCF